MKALNILACATALALAACSHHDGWKVSGTVDNAPQGTKLAVEAFNGARWYCLDSVEVAADGSFAYTAAEPAPVPDVYRLTLGAKSIYFPIDSVDAITVQTSAPAFSAAYTISGTALAAQLQKADSILARPITPAAKTALNQIILDDPVGVVAYYIINKSIGGKPLYDPADRTDLGMMGAIANKFDVHRPGDPRTKYLKQRFLEARRAAGKVPVADLPVEEVDLFDIDLYDKAGKQQSLRQVAEANPVVILSFTAYGLDGSPAYNVELNRLYEKYRSKGLEIYQVAFDGDEPQWHTAASNLPWITVYNPASVGDKYLAAYNVGALPMTYIIKNGAIAERVENPAQLATTLAKYL